MLPVMLASRKLDGEDPNIIHLLRCVYGAIQAIAISIVLFIYVKTNAAAKERSNNVKIYVPPAPQPFADPNAKIKYQEKNLSEHLVSTARSLLTSTLFGIVMTGGLHIWKGMIVGLAIQSIMCPFNLAENPLVSAFFLKGGLTNLKGKRIFGEKLRDELEKSDEIVDGLGNTLMLKKEKAADKKEAETKAFEDILLDTWDSGAEADISPLMNALSKKNINFAASENGWTPIMVMSGLGAKSVPGAMRQMRGVGANPSKVDKEGWNALHWAAFHGSAEAAKVLLSKTDFDGIALGLHKVMDKEGKSPLQHAKDEGNDDVFKVIEEAIPADTGDGSSDGLRKRK